MQLSRFYNDTLIKFDFDYFFQIFPYSYIRNYSTLKEWDLPDRRHFHNKLTDQPISDDEWAFAQKVYRTFNFRDLSHYYSTYLSLDVTLLVFSSLFLSLSLSI